MFQRSASRARFGFASAAVVALLVLSTGSVAADTTGGGGGDQSFSQNGKSADAGDGDCVSNGDGTTSCHDLSISVFAGKQTDSFSGVVHSSVVCANIGNYTFDDETGEAVGDPIYESGCRDDLASGLKFGNKLSSVTLAPTVVSIAQWVCADKEDICEPGPGRDVTVTGTWTGVGPTSFSKYSYSGDDGVCRFGESGKGYNREATFAGSVDGQAFGPNTYASINDGKSTYRSRCVEV